MIAGAGSNLNQQFGIPVWVGALICSLMILLISQFDFNKVSSIIGAFTPLIVGFIFLGTLMSLIIYGMIFNTGISFYYSLARRIGGEKRTKFNISLLILVSIGFMLSFLDLRN